MNGMSEKELLSLCDEKNLRGSGARWIYWTAEVYSFGKYIRDYAFYPIFLPLAIYTDHGAGCVDYPYKHELESSAPVQFYHSPVSVEKWKEVSSKPCYVLYSPFVFYRRSRKIEKDINASGTIAFPAHTTLSIDDVSDIEEYIKQLKELPDDFQPVSVCLHPTDINKGQYKVFMDHNIPVYTAGHGCDMRFAERFYNILKNFKYSTSNIIGSYTYYSVEMGIPFSIYGANPKYINSSDPNVTMGEYDPYNELQSYKIMYDLFNGLNKEISTEQREIVERDLGLKDGLNRLEMSKVLYRAFFKLFIMLIKRELK